MAGERTCSPECENPCAFDGNQWLLRDDDGHLIIGDWRYCPSCGVHLLPGGEAEDEKSCINCKLVRGMEPMEPPCRTCLYNPLATILSQPTGLVDAHVRRSGDETDPPGPEGDASPDGEGVCETCAGTKWIQFIPPRGAETPMGAKRTYPCPACAELESE